MLIWVVPLVLPMMIWVKAGTDEPATYWMMESSSVTPALKVPVRSTKPPWALLAVLSQASLVKKIV